MSNLKLYNGCMLAQSNTIMADSTSKTTHRSPSDRFAHEKILIRQMFPGLLVLEVDRLLRCVVATVDLEQLPTNAKHIAHLTLHFHCCSPLLLCLPRRHSRTLIGPRQVKVQQECHPQLGGPCQGSLCCSPEVFYLNMLSSPSYLLSTACGRI